jgi:hypothetical protein
MLGLHLARADEAWLMHGEQVGFLALYIRACSYMLALDVEATLVRKVQCGYLPMKCVYQRAL